MKILNLGVTAAPLKKNQGTLTEAPDEEFWMRAHDNVRKTAEELIHDLRDSELGWTDVACIGAACTNAALKAIAIAREGLQSIGYDLVAQPWFSTIKDDQHRIRTRMMIRLFMVRLH